jgi:hypothetical protein
MIFRLGNVTNYRQVLEVLCQISCHLGNGGLKPIPNDSPALGAAQGERVEGRLVFDFR